jgi:hypothetical protein
MRGLLDLSDCHRTSVVRSSGVHPATPLLTRGSWALGWGTICLWMDGFDGESTLLAQVRGSALGVPGGRLGGSRHLCGFWVPCLGLDSGHSVLTTVSDVGTRLWEYTVVKRGWMMVPPSLWCMPLGAPFSTSPPCPALLGLGLGVLSSPPAKRLEDGLGGPRTFSGPAGVSLSC